jgi:uncharacterized protein
MGSFRILFVSDLHGSDVGFRKFLNSVPVYHPDALVYGGDLLGKVMVPIFPNGDASFRWYPSGATPVRFPEAELASVERQIADQGRYSLVTEPEGWAALQSDRAALEKLCLDRARERLREWLRLIGVRLSATRLPVVLNVGNDDPDEILDLLRAEAPPNVLIPEGRTVPLGEYEIFGCGYANMTPWRCPRDLPEEKLGEVLQRSSSTIGNPRRTLFDIHAPPSETALDLAPALDDNLKPQTVSGEMMLAHVGSPSVRALIERVQPLASLHGHIHESRGADRIGSTPLFNPGSVYYSGQMQGVLLDLEGNEVRSHLFVTG